MTGKNTKKSKVNVGERKKSETLTRKLKLNWNNSSRLQYPIQIVGEQ